MEPTIFNMLTPRPDTAPLEAPDDQLYFDWIVTSEPPC